MAEYITKTAAINAVENATIKLFQSEWNEIGEMINAVPAADVVPASQERTYKGLLDALFEDLRNLDTTYSDACCMCSKGECDDCNLRTFEDELSAIIGRAAERKKRLAD